MKNYNKNVNLTIWDGIELYNGNSFVHVVKVVDCGDSEFLIGLVEESIGDEKSVRLISNKIWGSTENWIKPTALIAIKPTVVCTNSKKNINRKKAKFYFVSKNSSEQSN